MKKKYKIAVVLVLSVFAVSMVSAGVIVNSDDWHAVSLGLLYSHLSGEEGQIVNNIQEADIVARTLNASEDYTVLEPENDAVVEDYHRFIEEKGVESATKRSFNWKDDQYSLYDSVSDKVEGFIVVKPDFGIDTISVFPKAVADNYSILYYQEGRTEEFLRGEDKPVIFYGRYYSQPWKRIEGLDYEIIDTGTKAGNNLKITRQILEENPGASIKVANGFYLEKGFLLQDKPTVWAEDVGETVELIRDHNISTMEVIGPENVQFAQEVKSSIDRPLRVIVKTGRTFTGIPNLRGEKVPLKTVPVKRVEKGVEIKNISLDRENKRMMVGYRNKGNIQTTVRLTAVELREGGIGGRTETVSLQPPQDDFVLRPGQEKMVPVELGNISFDPVNADLLTYFDGERIYQGSTTSSIFNVTEGEFDTGQVDFRGVTYDNYRGKLSVNVVNKGEADAWTEVEVDDLNIFNSDVDIASDSVKKVESGESAELTFDVYLDEEDVKRNSRLNITVYHGPEKGAYTSAETYAPDIEVKSSISGYVAAHQTGIFTGLGVLIVLIASVFIYRRRYSGS